MSQYIIPVWTLETNSVLNSSSDGLTDCVDPDCCEQLSCGSDPLCHGSADPLALLQQNPLPTTAHPSPASTYTHGFYRRVRFLVGKAATHTLPGDVPFDTRYALVYSLCARVCVCMRIASLYLSSVCVLERRVACWKIWVANNEVNASLLMHCIVHYPYVFNESVLLHVNEVFPYVDVPVHTSSSSALSLRISRHTTVHCPPVLVSDYNWVFVCHVLKFNVSLS